MLRPQTISHVIGLVRMAGPAGCTAEYVASKTCDSDQAVRKALALQVHAGILSTEELFSGERYVGTIYRMRGSA